MSNRELILEARGWTHHSQVHDHAVSALDIIHRLADALAVSPDPAPSEWERHWDGSWEYARQNRYGYVCSPDDSREQAEYRASLGGGYDTVVSRPLVTWEPLPVAEEAHSE